MMKTRLFILASALALLEISAYPQKTADKPKIPEISDALKAKWFKAQLQLINAQKQFQSAQEASGTVAKEITEVCGKDFQPQIDPQGDPVCLMKPKQ